MPTLIRHKGGIFYIISTLNGKRIWKSTGTRNRKEAYQVFSTSTDLGDKRELKTLSACINEFIPYARTSFSPKTVGVYNLTLQHFLSFVGDLEVSKISPRHIDQFKIIRAARVTASTTNIDLRTLKAFFNCLKRWEIIDKNPCDQVRQIRIPEMTPAFFSQEELQNLVGQIKDRWLREIVIFAAMTGARLGEILNLTWNDIDLTKRVMKIESSVNYRVKAGKLRTVPINDTVMILLSSKCQNGNPQVFTGKRGGRANLNFVSEKFREIIRKLGYDRRLHFHSLRHTFASILVSKGVSLYQVQKLLGHSSSKITEIYAHLQPSEMHNVINSIAL